MEEEMNREDDLIVISPGIAKLTKDPSFAMMARQIAGKTAKILERKEVVEGVTGKKIPILKVQTADGRVYTIHKAFGIPYNVKGPRQIA